MKKILIAVLLLQLFITMINAQETKKPDVRPTDTATMRLQKKNDWVNPHPENLPGYQDVKWPSHPKPKDPSMPHTTPWHNDLSVAIKQVGAITQEGNHPYFTVTYQLTIKNLNGEGPLSFHLNLYDHYQSSVATMPDPVVLNSLTNKSYAINSLSVNSSTVVTDTVHVYYPYATSKSGLKKYLEIPVIITAEIPTYGFSNNGRTIIVLDKKKENNKDTLSFITPIPAPSLPNNTTMLKFRNKNDVQNLNRSR